MNPGVLTSGYRAPPLPYGLLGNPTPVPMPGNYLHPETQDWARRVRNAGGSVSGTTLRAVDGFVQAIYNYGLRSLFYRLNLFCGDSDPSLVAVRTPLFRGPSLTGTQFGGTTDTNVNFVQGDYAETGASSGLTGNGSTKFLDTGLNANVLTASSSHMGFGLRSTQTGVASFRALGGAYDGTTVAFQMAVRRADSRNNCFFGRFAVSSDTAGENVGTAPLGVGDLLMAYPSFYRNGTQTGAQATTSQNYGFAHSIYIFASSQGTPAINHTNARMNWYSIGLTMTPAQALSFNNAAAAFNSSLART